MECADLSKEEIEKVECARGIFEKEAAEVSERKVVAEVEDACEIAKRAPWVLDQAPWEFSSRRSLIRSRCPRTLTTVQGFM